MAKVIAQIKPQILRESHTGSTGRTGAGTTQCQYYGVLQEF